VPIGEYRFLAHWCMEGTIDELYDILRKVEDFPRWWRSSYRNVTVIDPGDENGVGKVFDLEAKGWLPYVLHMRFRTVEAERPHLLLAEAKGDLEGRATWTLESEGEYINITYDWRPRVVQPGLRYFSPILKPLFASNHIWTTARGEESLRLELARRHARTPEERALVPDPPMPTTASPVPVAVASLVVLVIAFGLLNSLARFLRRGR
jgi:hypothetical protein